MLVVDTGRDIEAHIGRLRWRGFAFALNSIEMVMAASDVSVWAVVVLPLTPAMRSIEPAPVRAMAS